MKKIAIALVALFVGNSLVAQTNPVGSSAHSKGQVTVQGCVGRSSGDYVLMQFDPGNSYVLHSAGNVKLADYLGQQVKVIGTQSSTVNDTSDSGRSAPSVTIVVNSITPIANECRP
jgi:type 1 fimbria pilin